MQIQNASDQRQWDTFVQAQPYASFLQSWTMGEVYREIGQEPIRLEAREDGKIVGICQAIVVPARRGRHLMIQYGPLIGTGMARHAPTTQAFIEALSAAAADNGCSFLRISPFLPESMAGQSGWPPQPSLPSPLHLLSEYTWYIPLKESDRWGGPLPPGEGSGVRGEESILSDFRKTTRNLVRRAEKEGVTVRASADPVSDLEIYFALQKETSKRHHFVPYRNAYIRAQVKHFSPSGQAIVYIAEYQGEPVAASVHMNYGGITSYHHGASTHKYAKIPASYLLQWTAIKDALKRGDDIYNFWGIAPPKVMSHESLVTGQARETNDQRPMTVDSRHPFAGVTTFKTGFGGKPLPLVHCIDIPLTSSYRFTRMFEFVRKWKRGF